MAKRKKGANSKDDEAIEAHRTLSSPGIYEVIRREGLEELRRPVASLWWSGVAAGLALSTSVFCQGFLYHNLPDTVWRPAISSFGYTVGFLIVILGRLQLFTENTITVVLPLLTNPNRHDFFCGARLWAVVLAANLAGTLFSAAVTVWGATPEQLAVFLEISHHYVDRPALEALLYGIPAGFLIAALVWIVPSAEGSKALVIIIVVYMIALGEMMHVIAGSAEVFMMVLTGGLPPVEGIAIYILGPFVGNVIGGTGLFALIAYGQVRQEL